jgi:two-component system phosphate regulon sensor histidine kinase PhoR
MKSTGMRWIIPAVVIAITALIIFQVNWLVREAALKTQDEKRRVGEALRETCIAMEEREAKAFIGNTLDSVFIRQPYTSDDSMQLDIVQDSITRIVVLNDSAQQYKRQYLAPPPVPPFPPGPPTENCPPLPPVPPEPPLTPQYDRWLAEQCYSADSMNRDRSRLDAQVYMMERKQRMCNAVEDVMLQYVFSSGASTQIDTSALDSTLQAKLEENGIDYRYDRAIISGPVDQRQNPGTFPSFREESVAPGKEWEFRSRLFAGDPDPLSPEIVLNIHPGKSSVFMRILPQIIFSFLITFGMLALFLMIYREALKQKKIGEIRRDFINNMTHEFKTPLATMSLAADTIMNEKIIGDKEKVKYYAEQIKSENRKLNQQVEKVLELALTEKTGVIMNKEEVNLTDLVLRAMKCMHMQVEAKGGTITLETEPQEILIQADPFHLERVFVNLFDNALKYGGTPPQITVNIEQYRGGTEIKISDNGRGIPSSDWDLIFEPFHRVSTGDIHNVKGFGLGLSYAKSVMSEHNGSVSVTKSNDSGTTFSVVLMHNFTNNNN